jgi:hypothetical protein
MRAYHLRHTVIPIQLHPASVLYQLRLNHGHDPEKHIFMLEQTIAELERKIERQRFLMQRIHDNLEAML